MRGSWNFCRGGGGGVQASLSDNRSDNVFFRPQLILQFLQRVSNGYFKENYNFPRFQSVI